MQRKELKRVRDLEYETRMWKRKLAELDASIIGSPSMDANGRSSLPSSPVENKAIRRSELTTIIRELEERAELERVKILRHILTIDDPLLRQIVNYRFVECMSWKKVAIHTGQSEESAQMIFYRAYPI